MPEQINVKHDVVIARKGGTFSTLALTKSEYGTIVGRYDPRFFPQICLSPMDSQEIGDQMFDKAIKTTIENGWEILFRGTPNWG